jgi:nucleoside-diphosphate-sugar epimerase
MELLSAVMAPSKLEDGTTIFPLPLGDGAIPFIHLGDFGKYVHWALSHPDRSNHLDFGIATAHVSGLEIEEAFIAHTGKPAKYVDLPIEQWNAVAWKNLPNGKDTKIGHQNVKDEDALLMTYGENFANWWNLYKASKDNKGLIQRDYAFLDEIVPDRVKSLAEWMDKVKYTGEKEEVLRLQTSTNT